MEVNWRTWLALAITKSLAVETSRMHVSDVMNPSPVTLPLSETFGGALHLIRERRLRVIPVIDDSGVYMGTFDLADVWKTLLPKAVLLGFSSLSDLSFVSDALDMLREKLVEADERPIEEFLDCPVEAIHPDTPLKEAVLLFYKHDVEIPVVERDTNRLVGLVSPWEILDSLR